MPWNFVLLLVFLVVLYLVIGGLIFWSVEKNALPDPNERAVSLEHIAQKFIDVYPHARAEDVLGMLREATNAALNGSLANATTTSNDNMKWDLALGIYFAGTIITTIGYGNVAPLTAEGQWLSILYGLIGIPLNLVMLAAIGGKMRLGVKNRVRQFLDYFGCAHLSTVKKRIVAILCTVIVGVLLYLIIPAAVLMGLEGWTYTEGFYFCFISLSTIGFGDYTISSNRERPYNTTAWLTFYRLLYTVWLFFGLAWLSTLLTALTELYNHIIEKGEEDVKKIAEAVRHHRHKEHAEDDKKHMNGTAHIPEKSRRKAEQQNSAMKSGPRAGTSSVVVQKNTYGTGEHPSGTGEYPPGTTGEKPPPTPPEPPRNITGPVKVRDYDNMALSVDDPMYAQINSQNGRNYNNSSMFAQPRQNSSLPRTGHPVYKPNGVTTVTIQ